MYHALYRQGCVTQHTGEKCLFGAKRWVKGRAGAWDHSRGGGEQVAVYLVLSLKPGGTKIRSVGTDFVSPAQQDGQLT